MIETRKSSGMFFAAPAAASDTPARLAFTKVPAAFCTSPYGMLFWIA